MKKKPPPGRGKKPRDKKTKREWLSFLLLSITQLLPLFLLYPFVCLVY